MVCQKRRTIQPALVMFLTGSLAVLCAACLAVMAVRDIQGRAELLAMPPSGAHPKASHSPRKESAAASARELDTYFKRQAVLAAGQVPVHRHVKGKIVIERDDENTYHLKTSTGGRQRYSGHKAASDLAHYFAMPGGGSTKPVRVGFETAKQSAAELNAYFNKMGTGLKNGLASKKQHLAAIGVGPETDNAGEVTKAQGIDKDGEYFATPVPPAQKHIDEANQAGNEQKIDGYTNVPTITVPLPPK
eukprot:CAMPEP_0114132992 /NCGR_PEP_ID=MMETSP0043_2-20121206/13390_1 /TAXON_ID=464988 /ORGANISM="Hemiselmis andersenii, Strain CCMP644" /LENGTH=245 /DNA_ID=CAMNT_0001226543 /DNA_START=14 /DNA_END=751 /DNA_ORIENTATION=+